MRMVCTSLHREMKMCKSAFITINEGAVELWLVTETEAFMDSVLHKIYSNIAIELLIKVAQV